MKETVHFKSIESRVVFYFCFFTLAITLLCGIAAHLYLTHVHYDSQTQKLRSVRDIQVHEINSWIERIIGDLKSIVKTNEITKTGYKLCMLQPTTTAERNSLAGLFDGYINNYNVYYELFIVSFKSGKIVYSTDRNNIGADRSKNSYVTSALQNSSVFIKDIYYSRNLNIPTMTFSVPVSGPISMGQKNVGVLVARIYLERSLYNILMERTGLGRTGESIIVNRDLVALNKLMGYGGFPLTLKLKDDASVASMKGAAGIIECRDYRGTKVLAAYRHIPRLNWGFVVKQDIEEIYQPLYVMLKGVIVFTVAAFIVAIITALSLSQNITAPVTMLVSVSNRIRDGDFAFRKKSERRDEFRKLTESFNAMADMIVSQLNIQRVSSDVIQGMVSTLDLEEFSKNVLKNFVEITESSLGAFYLLSPDGKEFEHLTSIGLSVESLETFHAGMLEGEFGRALATREITVTRNISQNSMVKLRTIIGDVIPREIMTVPLVVSNKTVAIISLANLTEYREEIMHILNQVRPVMNTAFSNIMSDEETRRLAYELSEKNQLLESQKEALVTQAAELRRQSERVKKQNIELENQQQKVEEANKLKSEFLSNMSHELRTPLNSILALSHVLLAQTKGKITDEETGYLEVIDRNGTKLLTLINDILDLSKIEAGRIDLKIRLLSLVQVVGGIVDNLEQIAEAKGIGLSVIVQGDVNNVESDESRVYQILQNIIGNAVKFTEKGGVTITLTNKEDCVSVLVRDTGIGIDKQQLPHIFEEFRQIDGTLSRKYDGTGLGLAIASKSAQLISATITVKSVKGRGSHFEVMFPRKWERPDSQNAYLDSLYISVDRDSADHVRIITDDEQGLGEPDAARDTGDIKQKILVVDDDRDNILAVRAILNGRYTLFEAYDGHTALEIAFRELPQLILLDMALPGKSGFIVIRELKKDSKTRHIPTMALTALTMSGDRERILDAGCDDYIPKPFDVKDLLTTIENWLGKDNA